MTGRGIFLSKRFNTLNGIDFSNMIMQGAAHLQANVSSVNALNVFPVPDGDTGTNMNLTLTSGVEELRKKPSSHIGKAAEALAKGLLMGARGNSGVILSQLLRGFAKSVAEYGEISVTQFAAALQQGVDTAYKAVVKPVEGTILTVAREAARHAVACARRSGDLAELMREVLHKAKEALAKTPEQLPVLKQVGVVDAGGQGLVFIYEGMLAALAGETVSAGEAADRPTQTAAGTGEVKATFQADRPGALAPNDVAVRDGFAAVPGHADGRPKKAQAHLATEDIEFGYCTEFMVKLVPGKTAGLVFDETRFRSDLERHGDSVLVVADDELVKVHLHAEYPGNVLTFAQQYGELVKIKIENMREQHTHLLAEDEPDAPDSVPLPSRENEKEVKPFGFVTVAAGEGITAIFESLGADVVLSGGQTMNPSTEDIVNAIERVDAETVFVLPNNSNIIMAAQQARDLLERRVVVIPTKTIPQGMSALLAFQPQASADDNAAAMERAIGRVQSGMVTYAVRDSQIDGLDIKQGDYLGIHNNRIVASTPDLLETCRVLLAAMIASGDEVVTILAGADASEDKTNELVAMLERSYPDAEVEVHAGGQPLYYYIFSVE